MKPRRPSLATTLGGAPKEAVLQLRVTATRPSASPCARGIRPRAQAARPRRLPGAIPDEHLPATAGDAWQQRRRACESRLPLFVPLHHRVREHLGGTGPEWYTTDIGGGGRCSPARSSPVPGGRRPLSRGIDQSLAVYVPRSGRGSWTRAPAGPARLRPRPVGGRTPSPRRTRCSRLGGLTSPASGACRVRRERPLVVH